MKEHEALLVLNAIEGLGNARIKKLVEHFGSARQVLSSGRSNLLAENIVPPKVVENIIHFSQDNFVKNEYNLITKSGARVITLNDEEYPYLLSQIPDAPVVLYIKGSVSLNDAVNIGIVGSRRASIYGLGVAEKFAVQLAEQGITVVSGLARGIDTAAHKGALKAHGKTVAVLGCGLSHIYPPENRYLYEEIAKRGAIISEFPFQRPPVAYNFPRRNRIISGLSMGLIVVEAAKRSGALITSDFALEQGREVYAVPGPIDRMSSSGVNHLIQQGAKLVTQIEDIIDDLEFEQEGFSEETQEDVYAEKNRRPNQDLTEQEQQLYQYINERPVHIDTLASKIENNVILTHQVLLQLELKHLIKQLPGKNFKRLR